MSYEWKITLKKMAIQAGIAVAGGAVAGLIGYFHTLDGSEFAIWAGVAIIGLKGLENWLKHRKD